MRKQDPTQIKLLHKKFHFLNKSDITIIYDFCQQNINRTQKILTIAKDIRNPSSIVKTLLQKPQKGQTLLLSLQRRYDQQYTQQKPLQNNKPNIQQTNNFKFFNYIPKDVLLTICLYLDPYSMSYFSMTCSKIYKFYQSQYFSQYYKNLCINLFEKYQPKLPDPCRFIEVRNYVYKNGNQFGPNTRNAVTNKLRYYVWQQNIIPQKKQKNYMLTFGSYRNLYYKMPRIHFNGIYMCKHQYRKQQQKNLLTNTSQVHYVNYYRYFRFIQDGSIISAVFSSKQKLTNVAEMMENKILEMQTNKIDKNLMIGQFIQTGNKIQVKLFKQGAIFTYILQLSASQINNKNQITDILIVKLYSLKVVDQKQIVQTLEQYNSKSPMLFKYYYNSIICKENNKLIKSSSL